MPAEALLTERGRMLIDEQPSWIREDPTNRAIQHCFAKESERMEVEARKVRDDLIPARASARGMAWHEALLKLPTNAGEALEVRRARVFARLAAVLGEASGLSWDEKVDAILGEGNWTHAENTPGAYQLRITAGVPASSLVVAELAIQDFSPAHIEIEVVAATGFVLDESQLDQQSFHP